MSLEEASFDDHVRPQVSLVQAEMTLVFTISKEDTQHDDATIAKGAIPVLQQYCCSTQILTVQHHITEVWALISCVSRGASIKYIVAYLQRACWSFCIVIPSYSEYNMHVVLVAAHPH